MTRTALFIGLTTIDIQYFVDDYPGANKKVKTAPPDILVGGPATNAAVAFSYLKGSAYLSSAVGISPFTPLIREDLSQTNVQFEDMVEGQEYRPILAAVITSKNGDRSILTHNPEKVTPSISAQELFDKTNPQVLLLDGFYPEFSLDCAKLAQKRNVCVVIDGGSWKPQYQSILQFTDVAICSADFLPPGCTCSDDVLLFLEEKGLSRAAISRGEKSILYRHNKSKGEVQAQSVRVKDTLGAGDFLHGAFCYYYLESGNFVEALDRASKVASKSCGYSGTRSWLNC